MAKVYIAQLKCPSNHCVFAGAGEYESDTEAQTALPLNLGLQFGALVRAKVLNNECGICHSTNLQVQVGVTRWNTLEDAAPHLRALEEAQLASAQFLKESRN
jgi:hypothetical protein